MYTAIVTAVIIGGLTILVIRSNRDRRKKQETVKNYVSEIFSEQSYCPEIHTGFTYGIPSFSLRFETDEEKEHAIYNGFTNHFIKKFQNLYGILNRETKHLMLSMQLLFIQKKMKRGGHRNQSVTPMRKRHDHEELSLQEVERRRHGRILNVLTC